MVPFKLQMKWSLSKSPVTFENLVYTSSFLFSSSNPLLFIVDILLQTYLHISEPNGGASNMSVVNNLTDVANVTMKTTAAYTSAASEFWM